MMAKPKFYAHSESAAQKRRCLQPHERGFCCKNVRFPVVWRPIAQACCCKKRISCTELACPSRNRTLLGWLRWMLAPSDASGNQTSLSSQRRTRWPSDASRNQTSLSWKRWTFAPSDALGKRKLLRCDGCSLHRMLRGTRRHEDGRPEWSPHRMLQGTGRRQDGSHGSSPHRMLLGTGRH